MVNKATTYFRQLLFVLQHLDENGSLHTEFYQRVICLKDPRKGIVKRSSSGRYVLWISNRFERKFVAKSKSHAEELRHVGSESLADLCRAVVTNEEKESL